MYPQVVGPTLTDEEMEEARQAVDTLCRIFGPNYSRLSTLNLRVGELIEGETLRPDGTKQLVCARFVCRGSCNQLRFSMSS